MAQNDWAGEYINFTWIVAVVTVTVTVTATVMVKVAVVDCGTNSGKSAVVVWKNLP